MPKQVDHDARREEIAAAAARVVAAQGIDSLTSADLAAAAGCTVGALPHYYRGKDAILLAALQYARRSVANRAAARASLGDGSLAEILSAALPMDADSRRDARVWFAFFGRALNVPEIAREYRQRYRALERDALVLLEGRSWRDGWSPSEVLEAIFASLDGLAMRALIEPRAWPATRQRDVLARQIALLVDED